MTVARFLIAALAFGLAGSSTVAAEALARADAPAAKTLAIYPLFELLQKSDRIVVAEVGERDAGVMTLTVREELKSPAAAQRVIDSEKLRRAEMLLADDKLDIPAEKPRPAAKVKLLVPDGGALPPKGTRAVFFLWETEAQNGAGDDVIPAYRVTHPQAIYDAEVLPQVKAALTRPRAVADGRYLREWDRQMAERLRQREQEGGLKEMKGGESVLGLHLEAVRPTLLVRKDNSFSVIARIENTLNREQMFYDGPISCYGVRIRAKDAPMSSAIVLRHFHGTSVSGVDPKVLEIQDITDFSTVSPQTSITKELVFEKSVYKALESMAGDVFVSVFYVSNKDGKGVEIGGPAWTGVMMSEEVPFRFDAIKDKKISPDEPDAK